MNEASKTLNRLTPEERHLLEGTGIDIGCGEDPIREGVVRFDREHGDANLIQDRVKERFDFVFSSHCLEHMRDVRGALDQWWGLVKAGGHLILVVPDEDLYEQGLFPSRFNADHRATFTISKERSWSPVSFNLLELATALPGGTLVTLRLQDEGYDRRLQGSGEPGTGPLARQALRLYRSLSRRWGFRWPLLDLLQAHYGCLDQTRDPAVLAQILCIVRKADNDRG